MKNFYILITTTLLSFVLFQQNGFTQTDEAIPQIEDNQKTAKTRSGLLEIRTLNDIESILFLDNEKITILEKYSSILKIFSLQDTDVVLIETHTGGNGVPIEYLLVILEEGKLPQTTTRFISQNQIKAKQIDQKVEIDLGFHKGKKRTLIYKNRSTQIVQSDPVELKASLADCKMLYGIYDKYLSSHKTFECKKEIDDLGSSAESRSLENLAHDPRLKTQKVIKMIQDNCEKNTGPITYEKFAQLICNH